MIYILCIADLRYKTSVMQRLRGEEWIGIGWSWSDGLLEVGSNPCQELPGVSAAQEPLNSGAAAILAPFQRHLTNAKIVFAKKSGFIFNVPR